MTLVEINKQLAEKRRIEKEARDKEALELREKNRAFQEFVDNSTKTAYVDVIDDRQYIIYEITPELDVTLDMLLPYTNTYLQMSFQTTTDGKLTRGLTVVTITEENNKFKIRCKYTYEG